MTASKMFDGTSQILLLPERQEPNPCSPAVICVIGCQLLIGACIGALMVLVSFYLFTDCSLRFQVRNLTKATSSPRGRVEEPQVPQASRRSTKQGDLANPTSEDALAVDTEEPLAGFHGSTRISATQPRSPGTQSTRMNPAQAKPTGPSRHRTSG